jgi:hypothetical protein
MSKLFKHDVALHFKDSGWDTYEVNADCLENARYAAVKRVIEELGRSYAEQINLIRIYEHNSDKLLKEYQVTE